ncbi:MAG: hypothetical protein KC615_17790 [Anaerolineae bacterium]|nr:hypothetical protein [Anaerolineae bacterium]
MTKPSKTDAIVRATNRSWDEWMQYMDSIDAKNLSHYEIATLLLDELDGQIDNHAWWAQSVTVAYEQYIGRRLPGQRSDGTFETSASKSTQLGMQDLMDKWIAFADEDEEVQAIVAEDVRSSGTEKRITWRTRADDGSSIRVTSEPKKNGTASIIVNHMELQTHELNTEAKEKWSSILERFVEGL